MGAGWIKHDAISGAGQAVIHLIANLFFRLRQSRWSQIFLVGNWPFPRGTRLLHTYPGKLQRRSAIGYNLFVL